MVDYSPLPPDDRELSYNPSHYRRSARLWKIVSLVELFALVTVGLWLAFNWHKDAKYPTIYSPMGHLTKYEKVVFSQSIHNQQTKYQGFSAEADESWHELYKDGVVALTKEEADQLPNRTSSIPDQPGMYIASFAVFHDLHCLNSLRKSLYREHYGIDLSSNGTMLEHMDHCIDSLRQAVMCSPDLSTLTWLYDENDQRQTTALDVVHSCRNFDVIREWVAERHLPVYDPLQRQPGDPVRQ